MTQRTATKTQRGIERGRSVVETLIRDPVKEAVREAMAEEGLDGRAVARGEGDQSARGSGRSGRAKLLLPLLAVAAVALYWRRRSTDPFETRGRGTPGASPATEPVTRPEPGEQSGAGSERSPAEGADEDAATSS